MSTTLLLSMISLSFAMSISPGPVNILILTSSINNGFLKTFAFISGATIGFTLLLCFIAFGFISFLTEFRLFLKTLSFLGALFIIFMGYKIAKAKVDLNNENKKDILLFSQGFLLQWLNPKAWIASVSGVSIYSSSTEVLSSFIFIYFLVCYICLSTWGILGDKISILFNTNKKIKTFNLFMGGLLIFTGLYLLYLSY